MKLEEVLGQGDPAKLRELSEAELSRLFWKMKGLRKQVERDTAFWSSTNDNLKVAYEKLDEQERELQRAYNIIREDLEVAEQVQRALLPKLSPEMNRNLDVAVYHKQLHQVGGDYYDYFRTKEGRHAIALFDISGHGASAALIMSFLKAQFMHAMTIVDTPKAIVERVNHACYDFLREVRRYATVNFVVFHEGGLRYVSGGGYGLLLRGGQSYTFANRPLHRPPPAAVPGVRAPLRPRRRPRPLHRRHGRGPGRGRRRLHGEAPQCPHPEEPRSRRRGHRACLRRRLPGVPQRGLRRHHPPGHPEAQSMKEGRAPHVSASFVVGPVGDVAGNLAAVLAESLGVLLPLFYPPVVCKKANVVLTELVQNVMEDVRFPESDMKVDLSVDRERLLVRVRNRVTDEQEALVSERLSQLETVEGAKKLFSETIRERRKQRLKGGIGLMRLVSENRFRLAKEYDGQELTVSAEFSLNGRDG